MVSIDDVVRRRISGSPESQTSDRRQQDGACGRLVLGDGRDGTRRPPAAPPPARRSMASCASATARANASPDRRPRPAARRRRSCPARAEGAISSTVSRSVSIALSRQAQRLVAPEPGDEVHVPVEQPVDLVELRVLPNRRRPQETARPRPAGRAARATRTRTGRASRSVKPARSAGSVGTDPGRTDERHRERLEEGRDVGDRDAGCVRAIMTSVASATPNSA